MISNNGNSVDGRVLLQVKHDKVNTAGAIAAGYQMTAAAVTSGTASYYDSLIFLESAGSGSETVHSAPKNIEFYVNNYNTAAGAGTSYTALGNLAFELQADGDAIFYDNVGIGTTSPDYKLEVSGTLGVSRTDGIIFAGSGGTGTGSKIASNTSNDLIFSTALPSAPYTTTERVRVLNNGNVGIGETNPDASLHIKNVGVPKIKLETTQSQYATPGQIEAWNGATNTLHGYLTWATNPGVTGARLAFQNAGYTSWLEVGNNYMRTSIAGSTKSHLNATGLGINNTNPQEDLDVTGTIKGDEYKGYLPAFQHGGFYHSSSGSSTTIYWIPTNYISETTSSQYYNNWIAPYSGRVKKIMMRYASGTTPTATSVTFRKSINGSPDLSTYPATIAGAASTNMTVVKEFGSTDITFNEGDRVQIGFTTNGGTRLLYGFAYTIVLEYDKD